MHNLNGKKTPTWDNLQTKLKAAQTAYNALDYSRKRKAEYDKLNQFELISDGGTIHKDAIAVIKKKYPKPE